MSDAKSVGRIVKVAGPVIDVEFPLEGMPEILHAITVEFSLGTDKRKVIAEVAQHLGDNKVRAIALAPTDGLTRGAEVHNTGGPITVPVGDQTLGHIFNVWGDSLDAPDQDFSDPRWPIHRTPPAFEDVEPQKTVFETGIKVLDLICPYLQGGKIGLFGGRRRWQDRPHPGDDQPGRHPAWWSLGVRWSGGTDPGGERPLSRDARVGRDRKGRPGLRPDGRAARSPSPGRTLRPDHGRVLPRCPASGRLAVHRQHLPLHPGRLGGLDSARAHAFRGRLPADIGRRDGLPPGADHLAQGSFDHLTAGHLRPCRRHHRPRAGTPRSPISMPPRCCPGR